MCTPGSVLPDSVCHSIFPQPFAGNRGPRGVCFDFDDIRCAWLEDNEVVGSEKLIQKNQRIRSNSLKQTMFFQTEPNGTVFDFQFPVKGRKTRPKKLRTMKNTVRKRHSAKKTWSWWLLCIDILFDQQSPHKSILIERVTIFGGKSFLRWCKLEP